MSLTQKEIADHLDLDQSAVSRFLGQIGIDWRQVTLDEIRIAYVRRLRAQADGQRSDGGLDLVHERVLSERVDRELKEFNLAEKKAQLINVAQLQPELEQMVNMWKSVLIGTDNHLKARLDEMYNINIDISIINDCTAAAFTHIAQYDISNRTRSLVE